MRDACPLHSSLVPASPICLPSTLQFKSVNKLGRRVISLFGMRHSSTSLSSYPFEYMCVDVLRPAVRRMLYWLAMSSVFPETLRRSHSHTRWRRDGSLHVSSFSKYFQRMTSLKGGGIPASLWNRESKKTLTYVISHCCRWGVIRDETAPNDKIE